MKRSTLVVSLLLYFLALSPAVESTFAKDSWVSVRSKNFFLVGNASEKEVRQVGKRLEQFREAFSIMFSRMNFKSPVPTTVIVFKNDNSYKPFKPNANAAGYFQPGPDVNYITLTTELSGDQDQFNVIFHEYTHLLINSTSGNLPTWFDEGLAEVYSTFRISEDQKVVLGQPIANHILLLRDKKILPLRTLFQVDHKSPYYNERDKQSVFYAESWALMHYLIFGRNGERAPQISKFIELTSANVQMEQAFQQAFGIGFDRMEKELQEYIGRDRYPIMSGHFENKLGVDTAMQSAPVSEAEVQAYLGDLLFHSQRAEAEGYLQKALALDPDLAMAHASLGMLHVRQGKPAEARTSLERALAANSQNYLVHYYYAELLSREGVNDAGLLTSFAPGTVDKMRAELKQAIELRPDFPESYRLLAFVNLVSGTDLDETVALLKGALANTADRNDLIYMLAQIYLRKEEYQTARQLLEKLSGEHVEADLRQRAQALLVQVGRLEERAKDPRNRAPQLGSFSRGEESEMVENADPSSHLREALRKPDEGETQVQGLLMRLDCDAKGITFVIRVGDRQLRLKTAGFEHLQIVSFSPDAGNEITCGARKPENNVIVNYAHDNSTKIDGVIRSLEFVPKDFQLNPQP